MQPSELQKKRDGQSMIKAAHSAWIKAKNKKTAIAYADENGDIVIRNPSGHKRVVKRLGKVANASS
jgi:ribosomal protein S11